MDEPSLDEFAEEHPTVAAPAAKASDPPKGDALVNSEAPVKSEAVVKSESLVKSEALVKIVITDEQLASSWDMFPQEDSSHPATADLGDIPLLSEPQAWVRPAAPAPAPAVARQQPARRSLLRPAAMVIFVIGVLIGGRMVMNELNAPPPSAAPVVPAASTPPAPDVVSASEPPAAAVSETSPNDVSVEPRREIDTPPREVARQVPARAEQQRVPARAGQQRPGLTRSSSPPRNVVAAAAIPAAAAPAASRPSSMPAPPSSVSTPASTTSAPPPVAAAPSVREEPRAAEAPTAPAVAASTPPTAAAPTPPPVPAMTPETRAVFLALNRYQQAFSTLDAEGVHDVWPGVDVKALDRAFNQLDEQTFDMQRCEVTVAGARAEATCDGTASYVRKVGRKAAHLEPRRWLFTLRQDSDQWVIDRVQVR